MERACTASEDLCICRARYLVEMSKRACETAARDVAMLEERRRLCEAPTSRVAAEQQPACVAKEVSATRPCTGRNTLCHIAITLASRCCCLSLLNQETLA